MRSAALWAGSVVLMAGCAGAPPHVQEPVVRTVEVIMEVPTKCIAALPARPVVLAPLEIAKLPAGLGVATLGAGYALLWDYAARLEAVASPCAVGD